MPVNDNNSASVGVNHWSLLIFSRHDDTWYHVDSNHGSNRKHARHLASKVNMYLNGNKQPNLTEIKFCQQNNSYDCGAYTMLYAQMAARRAIEGNSLDNLKVEVSEPNKLRDTIFNLILLESN
ncbi:unnamed protein product [Meganyctiphanes norvegica]|uniref:Ubiquitin-like protease family profile domain-containing protein n=1 Tax=Meganyctiphanes norvegica TaxID=48144 RepID=A0AAV2PL23_MEGNR